MFGVGKNTWLFVALAWALKPFVWFASFLALLSLSVWIGFSNEYSTVVALVSGHGLAFARCLGSGLGRLDGVDGITMLLTVARQAPDRCIASTEPQVASV